MRGVIRRHIGPVTIVQPWVCESQLVAGGGGIIFGSLRPGKVVPISWPPPGHRLGPLPEQTSSQHSMCKHIIRSEEQSKAWNQHFLFLAWRQAFLWISTYVFSWVLSRFYLIGLILGQIGIFVLEWVSLVHPVFPAEKWWRFKSLDISIRLHILQFISNWVFF